MWLSPSVSSDLEGALTERRGADLREMFARSGWTDQGLDLPVARQQNGLTLSSQLEEVGEVLAELVDSDDAHAFTLAAEPGRIKIYSVQDSALWRLGRGSKLL
ncbi:MAG TPA: hypothetical protein VGQ89_08350 [Candidatus Limnocylindrales bacterium]|jgi:hypothetical protein|nr:hypothetical protein [Candidatus Limnocylindrales bacterium]